MKPFLSYLFKGVCPIPPPREKQVFLGRQLQFRRLSGRRSSAGSRPRDVHHTQYLRDRLSTQLNGCVLCCFLGLSLLIPLACSHLPRKRALCGNYPCASLLYRLASLEQQTSPEAHQLRAQLQEACEQGNAEGCVHFYVAQFFGFGGSLETKTTQKNLLAECEKKTELACSWCYRLAQTGIQGTDRTKLLALVRDNCRGGHPESCMLYGGAYLDGFGVRANYKKARHQLQTLCEKGDQTGCLGYALCLELGMGVKQNSVKARQLAEKACESEVADACSMLGTLWQDGRGGSKNLTRAKGLYKKGCHGYSLLGCYNLAALLIASKEPKKRLEAREYFGFTCRLGDEQACNDYANLLLEDHKPESDRKARGLYQTACDRGFMRACGNLAMMVEKGQGGVKDIPKAKRLYRLACKKGLRNACKHPKRRKNR